MKKKSFVITLYLLFLAALFEGSARLAYRIPGVSDMLLKHDLGWRQSWIDRHASSGQDIYYTFDVFDATKGWISRPDLRNMQVFDGKVLNTNSRGFRGTADPGFEKPDGITRILILGDSFTFGDEVSDDETYAHYLQKLLPDTEIINLGVHGYGHDQMLILLQETGIKYKPDIILLGFLPMDMSRNMLPFRDFAKPYFVLDDDKLVLKGVPVPTPEEVVKRDWLRPRIIDVLSALHQTVRKMLGLYTREMDQLTAALLKNMASIADSIGAVPVWVYLPQGGDISIDPKPRPGEEYMFSVCATSDKIKCFSARPNFAAKLLQGKTFRESGHWGPSGHRTVAEAIRDYLVKTGYAQEQI